MLLPQEFYNFLYHNRPYGEILELICKLIHHGQQTPKFQSKEFSYFYQSAF